MIKIKELRELEIPKYGPVFQCVFDLFGDYTGVFFKIEVDGVDKLLQRLDNLCVIYTLEDSNVVSYEMFAVDENYKVVSAGFDDYEMHIVDGTLTTQKRNNSVIQSLNFSKRNDDRDNDGFDGVIAFVQFNCEKNIRVTMSYQQMYNSSENIYYYYERKPLQVIIEKMIKNKRDGSYIAVDRERFIRVDMSRDDLFYDLVTLKEFGLVEFMSKGSYSLQKDDHITRYMKFYFTTRDNQAIPLFPFSKHLAWEEVKKFLEDNSFDCKIPEHLANTYNGNNDILNYYQSIADFIGDYENIPPDEVVHLKLEFGGVNDDKDN